MEKQKLLYQQARLHDRGAAEMVLQTISASKGASCLAASLKLSSVKHYYRPATDSQIINTFQLLQSIKETGFYLLASYKIYSFLLSLFTGPEFVTY